MSDNATSPKTQTLYPFESEDTAFPKFDVQSVIPQDVIEESKLKAEQDKPDFDEMWRLAQFQTSLVIAAMRNHAASQDEVDPDWRLPDYGTPEWEGLTQGIPAHRIEEFMHSTSAANAQRIRNTILEDEADLARLAQGGGGKATAALLGAGITDPAMLGIGVTTGSLGYWGASAARLSRLSRILAVGGVEGATGYTAERYIQRSKNDDDQRAALMAGAVGLLVGGTFAGLSKHANEAIQATARDAVNRVVESAVGHDSAGAARATAGVRPLVAEGEHAGEVPHGASPLNIPQPTISSQLTRSESPTARDVGLRAVEQPVGLAGHEAAPIPATTRARLFATQRGVEFYREARPAYMEWFREQGLPVWKYFAPSTRERFYEEVSDAIEHGTGSGAVRRVADAISENFRKTLEFYKAQSGDAAEHITHSNRHLPHIWVTAKIRAAYVRFGEGLETLFEAALLRKNPQLEAKLAKRVGRAMVTRLRRAEAGMDEGLVMPVTKDQIADLRDYLTNWRDRDGAHIESDEIDTIMYPFEKAEPSGGEPARLKRRALLDVETELPLYNSETGKTEMVSLTSLMERNAERLHNMYVRQLGGAAAWAQAGFKNKADWDKTVRQVISELEANPSISTREIKTTKENLDFLWRERTGAPHEDDPLSLYSRTARVLRAWNFGRMMGQMGLAQLNETSNLVSYAGLKTLTHYMPEMLNFVRQAKTGKLSSELLEEVEMVFGLGSEHLRSAISSHADSVDEIVTHGLGLPGKYNRLLDKADVALSFGQKVTNQLSLFAPINTALHRMAGMAILHKFTKLALQGGEANMKRLAVIGLDKPMLDRVLTELRANAVTKPSLLGGDRKLVMTNIANWADKEAADAFTHAVYSQGRRIIQENDVGATHRWMHTTTGKLLFQFRNFMTVAHTKNLLHNIHMQDTQALMTFMLGGLNGMMIYSGRQYINLIGDKDREKKMRERLAPWAIVKDGWAMSSWAAMSPAMIDTMALVLGAEQPIFGYNRTSGLGSGILANPTVDLVATRLPGVARGIKHALMPDYKFTKEDARNMVSTMLWTNASIIRNGLNALHEDLPSSRVNKFIRRE